MTDKLFAATCGTCASHDGTCLELRSRYRGQATPGRQRACGQYHRRPAPAPDPNVDAALAELGAWSMALIVTTVIVALLARLWAAG